MSDNVIPILNSGTAFCSKCKYFYGSQTLPACLHPNNLKIDKNWFGEVKKPVLKPDFKNRANDCQDFVRKIHIGGGSANLEEAMASPPFTPHRDLSTETPEETERLNAQAAAIRTRIECKDVWR